MTGTKGKCVSTVMESDTAAAVGSGNVRVFATPMMIALWEKTAAASIQSFLKEGQTTVGTRIDITHCSATPVGMGVTAETEVIGTDGRKVTFSVKAYDGAGIIGEGTHERFIVDMEKFQRKADSKCTE